VIELLFGGGGDQGDLVEDSTHLKPSKSLIHMENPRDVPMAKKSYLEAVNPSERAVEEGSMAEQGESSKNRGNQLTLLENREGWALEVYQGKLRREEEAEIEDGILELELDEEEARETSLVMGVTPHVSKPHDYVNHMFMRP
jgi:hypothetical protein